MLWCRIGSSYSYSRAYRSYSYPGVSRSCKVDVLIPGIMNIPSVPREKIVHIDSLPSMPLIPLILLKLQAWEDHRNAFKSYHRMKQWTDVNDLELLLPIAISRRDSLEKETWLPGSFVSAAKDRITRYLQHYPGQAKSWAQIGVASRGTSHGSGSTLAKTRKDKYSSVNELSDLMKSTRF